MPLSRNRLDNALVLHVRDEETKGQPADLLPGYFGLLSRQKPHDRLQRPGNVAAGRIRADTRYASGSALGSVGFAREAQKTPQGETDLRRMAVYFDTAISIVSRHLTRV
jgi:hypothetical protein